MFKYIFDYIYGNSKYEQVSIDENVDITSCILYDINNNTIIRDYMNDFIGYKLLEVNNAQFNIIIDNENNIIYNFNSSIQDVLNKEFITIEIGNKVLKITRETLYIKNKQQFIFKDNGILKIDELNLFSTKNRGNIYINITLY